MKQVPVTAVTAGREGNPFTGYKRWPEATSGSRGQTCYRAPVRLLLGDVAPAAGERDDQAALAEHHNRPAHRVDRHAVLGGQVTLGGQACARPQAPGGDARGDVVGELDIDVDRPGRVNGRLLSHTAHGI